MVATNDFIINPYTTSETIERRAKLNDGRIVSYDLCVNSLDSCDQCVVDLLGEGVIHSIRGVQQKGEDKYYFFNRKTKSIFDEPESVNPSDVLRQLIIPLDDCPQSITDAIQEIAAYINEPPAIKDDIQFSSLTIVEPELTDSEKAVHRALSMVDGL